MKKILFFFAAMLVALTANATSVTISPSSTETDVNFRAEVNGTADTIILNDGEYIIDDQVKLKRNLVVKAAEGAKPLLKPIYYCAWTDGAKVTFDGVIFDGTRSSQQAIRVYDNSAGKELRLYNCEFQNHAKDVIACDKDAYMMDTLIIDNCYFHNNEYCAVYCKNSNVADQNTIKGLKVTNSTFANNNPAKEYRALIDVQSYNREATDAIEVLVDHCTFYNNTVMNYDYSAIRTRIVNKTTVSNCIFAHPSSQEWYATNAWAGNVKNCLAYNFSKGYMAGPTLTEANTGDPKFVDAPNGDFTLGSGSPALGAGTDASNLGDPRWWPAAPAGCDWDGLSWLGDGSTEQTHSNQYKLCVGDPAPSNVATANVQTPNWPGHEGKTGIYVTFPSAAFGTISLAAADYVQQGAGLLLLLSAFDAALETEVTVNCDSKDYVFTIYNAKGGATPVYHVTFAAEGAEGIVPAAQDVDDGQSIKMPVNKTLYKDGYTLTGWNDGTTTYAIGEDFTPAADATLNAVFTANESDLLTATVDITVKWAFGEANDAPSVHFEGGAGNGLLVTQVELNSKKIDVKLAIDATAGKFFNKERGDKWAQVNNGTKFSLPSKEGATVEVETYAASTTSELDGATGTIEGTYVGTYAANPSAGKSLFEVKDGSYYAYLQVTLPATVVKYDVDVADGILHGTVEADKTKAEEGEVVTLTITPADFYELEAVEVNGVALVGNTFNMPAEDVLITASFKLKAISLAEFLTAKSTTEEALLKDLTVIYANGKNTYVVDEEGVALVIYDANKDYYDGKLTAGKVLSGQKAKYGVYNNQDQIIPTIAATVTDGVAAVPTLYNALPTTADVNKYIRLENQAVAKDGSNYYIGDKALQVYGVATEVKPAVDGDYNLEGLIVNFKTTQLELIVTSIELINNYVPTGDGTEANPYTVADVIGLAVTTGTEDVWVTGFVMGAWKQDPGAWDADTKSNIILADAADETEATKMIAAGFPTGAVRDALNVVENDWLVGKQVSVKGQQQAYFGGPGIKNVSDYKRPEKPTAIDNANANVKAVKVIENGQLFIIKNGVKYNAIGEVVK